MLAASEIKERAMLLEKVRFFFKEKNVVEVDLPSLVPFPNIDDNIELFSVSVSDHQTAYLHSSPEFFMKKLLANGSDDIYFLGHVFRKEEKGSKHLCEFTMIEWYKKKTNFLSFMEENCELLSLFLDFASVEKISYKEAFIKYAKIDPFTISLISLQKLAKKFDLPTNLNDKDDYLHLFLTHFVEPNLGKNKLTILYDYPASQAALATTSIKEGNTVANRFEIYFEGVELANAYEEATSSKELLLRFEKSNYLRKQNQKPAYPIDFSFLQAVDKLPPCCGISIGFDRLLMLRKKKKIFEVAHCCF